MDTQLIHWTEAGQAYSAVWRSKNGAAPPKRVVIVDDATPADTAYRLACEGTGLLWQGDFQNARQLLQSMARRIDKPKPVKVRKAASTALAVVHQSPKDVFNLHRQAQSQRARTLGQLLIPLHADYSIKLRRAPNWQLACEQVYGSPSSEDSVVSLRELLGVVGAYEWRKNGVEIPELGQPPHNRIHPHYGVFSPIRGEYLKLIASTPLPASGRNPRSRHYDTTVFDIGTGTGVIAAILAKRGINHIVATDMDARALACANDNLSRLGLQDSVKVVEADLFPDLAVYGKASLIVCNPPWLPARPSSPLEHAIYDEGSRMLKGVLSGVAAHLLPHGEAWLILSDLAEHLGLRSRDELMLWIATAGLKVISKHDARPVHAKSQAQSDPLHMARCKEITSLWRLCSVSN